MNENDRATAATFSPLADSTLHRSISAQMVGAGWQNWPSTDQLNALLPPGSVTCAGQPLSFSYCDGAGDEGAAAYETHIDQTGVIPLRPRHWHDLFNALMWASFPATKSALNAIHIKELARTNGQARTRRRDAVTLLDECGVLLLVDDEGWTARHREHDWRALFVARRDAWGSRIQPMTIGHGLLEQCLSPYIGLTGKALHLRMPPQWFALPEQEQRGAVDQMLSGAIAGDQCVLSTKELLPLPVLGIPGWWPDNESPSFYANRDYFRPARSYTRT